jgi:hypothetical protein
MSKYDSYTDFSRYDVAIPTEIPKNEINTRGLIALGVVLLGITTIVGWYMISGPEPFSISYMIVNLIMWGTSLALILFGYNKRNI